MKLDVSSETVNMLFDNGFEEQILDVLLAFENSKRWNVSDIPISPVLIDSNEEEIIINQEIYKSYQLFLQRINNVNTAGEIPFILLGKQKEINGRRYIFFDKIQYMITDNLSEVMVHHDGKKLENLINNSSYDVISIGHTHGNVAEETKNTSLTRNIPESIASKYRIRDVGLNLSIADINSHQSVLKYAKNVGDKKILQTVIMYNGDMIILGSNGITKCNQISALLDNGDVVSLPTASNTIEKNMNNI
ncbi:MAG: hypothetical protein V8Q75_05170 [Bacilli bacterium]